MGLIRKAIGFATGVPVPKKGTGLVSTISQIAGGKKKEEGSRSEKYLKKLETRNGGKSWLDY